MQFFSALSLLALTTSAASAASLFTARNNGLTSGNPQFPIGIAPATYDGNCTYPKPAAGFEPSKYVGPEPEGDTRTLWYNLAAQEQIFLQRCGKCVLARYGSFPNGTVTVENRCSNRAIPTDPKSESDLSSIRGTAPPLNDYGVGSFKVNFGFPTGSCPGPNYVVQKIYTYSKTDPKKNIKKGDYKTVIVSSNGFDGWFLLTREKETDQATLDVSVPLSTSRMPRGERIKCSQLITLFTTYRAICKMSQSSATASRGHTRSTIQRLARPSLWHETHQSSRISAASECVTSYSYSVIHTLNPRGLELENGRGAFAVIGRRCRSAGARCRVQVDDVICAAFPGHTSVCCLLLPFDVVHIRRARTICIAGDG